MAKVIIDQKQIKKISKNISSKFSEFTEDPKEMKKAGNIILREIKANSRQGIGYDGASLPGIKSKWSDRRKALAASNKLSRFVNLGSSGSTATFMGDTINKIKFTIGSTKRFFGSSITQLDFFGDGKHRKIKGVRGKPLKGSGAPISEILSGLKDLGYKIIGVSDEAKIQITENFRRYLRRKLR